MVFVGGSFKRGGHNLLEPAYFDCAIVIGPDMSNHQIIADDMLKIDAAIQITDQNQLMGELEVLLDDSTEADKHRTRLSQNALDYVKDRKQIIDNYIDEISVLLDSQAVNNSAGRSNSIFNNPK